MQRARVLVLLTGGTILMEPEPGDDVLRLPAEPAGLAQAGETDVISVANLDSCNVQPELWTQLAQQIAHNASRYDGFVVVHGTDTMAFTSSALALLLETTKPVVCTGAQVPLSCKGRSDGVLNLTHAIQTASLDIGEVCVVFGGKILRGSRVRKRSAFHLDAFFSPSTPLIGEFGVNTSLSSTRQRRGTGAVVLRSDRFDQRVAWLPLYPGMSADLLQAAVASGAKGLFLQGFGMGHIPTLPPQFLRTLHRIVSSGVSVVLGTQCIEGGGPSVYALAQAAEAIGIISVTDMTPEMTVTKLMWALGQSLLPDRVRHIMETEVARERAFPSSTAASPMDPCLG